jgi:sugar lactone lactonase YvrE
VLLVQHGQPVRFGLGNLAEGRHLGTIRAPELPANMAWGDADGRTLYFTARTGVYRLRLPTGGMPRTTESTAGNTRW